MSANLVRRGIFKSMKILMGRASMSKSVRMLKAAVVVNSTRVSIHLPPLPPPSAPPKKVAGSQELSTGTHWKTMANSTATMWVALATFTQAIYWRTPRFCPNSRSKKSRIDALTSASIGLYRS